MADISMNVLLVEDSTAMRRLVRSLLRQIGIEHIEEAGDGDTAWDKLHGKPFGLVLSDWHMEPTSGLQLLKKIRADDKLRKLPFIMLTTKNTSENVAAAKEAGVNNYIVKPFNAATLKRKIEGTVGALEE